MLVEVNKFIFLVDFVVLDIEEHQEIPLILAKSFLVTDRALIDVQGRQLALRINEKTQVRLGLVNSKYQGNQFN